MLCAECGQGAAGPHVRPHQLPILNVQPNAGRGGNRVPPAHLAGWHLWYVGG